MCPRIQIHTWLSVALLIITITASAWARLTGDGTAGWIGLTSALLFGAAALTLERLMSRLLRGHYHLKGSND